jgi:hypothetical protein
VVYRAADRVYLDAGAYSAAVNYALGALVLQTGKVYICTTAIVAPEAFTPGHWTLLGAQYDIFFASFPQNVFNVSGAYNKGDNVYWNGHTYTSLVQTISPDHEMILQYGNTNNIPYPNIFPDDPNNRQKYWRDNGAYTVPAGSLLDTTRFTKGDNRSQQLVMYLIDMTLFHLHSRISPRNIPEIRVDRYESAITWLNRAAKGVITANLVKIQPPSGKRIRWGSNIKNDNNGY